MRQREDYAIQQNLTILRNRVNELGVSEPIVQRQGLDRINVQLPGVQNSAEVKDLLGKVATLELRLADTQNNALQAEQSGHAPLGTKLYKREDGSPILLKREVIVTGDELTSATTGSASRTPTENSVAPSRINGSAVARLKTYWPAGIFSRLTAKRRRISRSSPMAKKSIPDISCANTRRMPESASVLGSIVEA
jgi:preprotein translocase subunit SecD